MEPRLNERIT